MQYKQFGSDFVVRIDRGEEVLISLKNFILKEKIKLASITGIGAADEVTVGLYDVASKKYYSTSFHKDLEITALTGNITAKDGEPYIHLHVSLSDIEGKAYGGHLNKAVIGGTCELFIHTLDGTAERMFDNETGLNIIHFS